VLVACGPGNNGGDGFVAARVLAGRGFDVSVALLGRVDDLRGDAASAARDWTGPVLPLDFAAPEEADLIVDALFGAGLSRDLDGEAAALVARINETGKPIVAVDVPCGIDGDTGAIRGIAVRAADTVTFCRRKPGHLLYPGRGLCGRVHVADIGIADETVAAISPHLAANDPALWREALPRPAPEGHKYGRGHAVVVSGGLAHTGAARLAARAALRAGAGLVTLASPPDALVINAAQLTAVMVREVAGAEGLARLLDDERLNALVIGPGAGIGPATERMVEVAGAAKRALVLDADALTSFAGNIPGLRQIVETAGETPIVLTPHEGEFARLLKDEEAVLHAGSKLARARCAAERLGAIVLLKGADTVIAAPDGRAVINSNGTPWLATAGAGDVLSGMIAGLLAQHMPPFEATCAAAWMHAAAGSLIGPGLIAEDLPELLPRVLAPLMA
jgi:hydroxyethylthiazole kinase-like uncharacterized protein yjeF